MGHSPSFKLFWILLKGAYDTFYLIGESCRNDYCDVTYVDGLFLICSAPNSTAGLHHGYVPDQIHDITGNLAVQFSIMYEKADEQDGFPIGLVIGIALCTIAVAIVTVILIRRHRS